MSDQFAIPTQASSNITPVLARNHAFAAAGGHKDAVVFPNLRLFVVTCLDPRVDPVHFLGLELSDAIVVRNAGGRVTQGVINDVAFIAQIAENVLPDGPLFEVAVIHHTQCGAGALADATFRRRYARRIGADEADLRDHAVLDPAATVTRDLDRLCSAPAISDRVTVSGHVYDVLTGLVQTILPARGKNSESHARPAGRSCAGFARSRCGRLVGRLERSTLPSDARASLASPTARPGRAAATARGERQAELPGAPPGGNVVSEGGSANPEPIDLARSGSRFERPRSTLSDVRLPKGTLEPLCHHVGFRRRLVLAAAELERRLSALPHDRWRIEPYPLTGGRRNPLLVLGATGVFVISATYPPGSWDDVVAIHRLAGNPDAATRLCRPGPAGDLPTVRLHRAARLVPSRRTWHLGRRVADRRRRADPMAPAFWSRARARLR
jgi:carbonic anhydrase